MEVVKSILIIEGLAVLGKRCLLGVDLTLVMLFWTGTEEIVQGLFYQVRFKTG